MKGKRLGFLYWCDWLLVAHLFCSLNRYYAYYASTMPTMPVLCLYYAYYACTMPTMPIYNHPVTMAIIEDSINKLQKCFKPSTIIFATIRSQMVVFLHLRQNFQKLTYLFSCLVGEISSQGFVEICYCLSITLLSEICLRKKARLTLSHSPLLDCDYCIIQNFNSSLNLNNQQRPKITC